MVPFLTVPPHPHLFLSCLAKSSSLQEGSGKPVITVTPFPLRPFVSRPIRTVPSPRMIFLSAISLQIHPFTGFPQAGHILPLPVEYTKLELFGGVHPVIFAVRKQKMELLQHTPIDIMLFQLYNSMRSPWYCDYRNILCSNCF
jgi:hypothetical protein